MEFLNKSRVNNIKFEEIFEEFDFFSFYNYLGSR